MTDGIVVGRAGPIVTVQLDRPCKLNAFTATMRRSLMAALEDAATDDGIRVVVLRGAGSGFGAGQDLAEIAEDADLGRLLDEGYVPIVRLIRAMPKPVIAAVHGVAAGAAANLALACDIVVATESARFIQAFVRIGLLPDVGGTWVLPRLVGLARARAICMLGLPIDGTQAAAWGMIWRAVPDARLDAEIEVLASTLAALPTGALAAMKRAFDEAASQSMVEQLALESRLQTALGHGADFREGRRAFLDKRPPTFGARPDG